MTSTHSDDDGTAPASLGLLARPPRQSSAVRDDMRPIAWLIMMGASAGLLLASWNAFPYGAHGMHVTNAVSLIATLTILCGAWLRTTLPRAPAVLTAVLCGIVVVLIGAGDHGHSAAVEFWCCSLGAATVFGAAAQR
jgi:hypothetical protein